MSDNLKHDVKAFGADFRARRKAAKLTQAEVGMEMEGRTGKIGVHPNFINGVERGRYPALKASTRRRLNEALERAIYNKHDPKGMRNAWPTYQPGELIPVKPGEASRKPEAVETFLLFLASVAVGALAVLAYNVMNGC